MNIGPAYLTKDSRVSNGVEFPTAMLDVLGETSLSWYRGPRWWEFIRRYRAWQFKRTWRVAQAVHGGSLLCVKVEKL